MLVDLPDSAGKGGTSTSGNIICRLMKDHRTLLASLVPEKFKFNFEDLVTRLWAIINTYN